MDSPLQRRLIEGLANEVVARSEELTALDQAIGDGDHGINMRRGAEAVLARIDELAAIPLPLALKTAGTALIMTIGGASGPLYGTLLLSLGRELPAAPTQADLARALAAAVEAVMKIGRAGLGQKTMLDVLAPVRDELAIAGSDTCRRVRLRAVTAADSTVPMRATKGRASFLGDRSIGHMDPGARSSSLMIATACEILEGQTWPT